MGNYNEENQGITCPFCGDNGYDLTGLKGHLVYDCEVYQNLESTIRRWI